MSDKDWSQFLEGEAPNTRQVFFGLLKSRNVADSEVCRRLRVSPAEFSNWKVRKSIVPFAIDRLEPWLSFTDQEVARWRLGQQVDYYHKHLMVWITKLRKNGAILADIYGKIFLKAIMEIHSKKRHFDITSEISYFKRVIFSVDEVLRHFLNVYNETLDFYDDEFITWHLLHPNNLAVTTCLRLLLEDQYGYGKEVADEVLDSIRLAIDSKQTGSAQRAAENAIHIQSRLGLLDQSGALKSLRSTDPFTLRAILFAKSDDESIAECERRLSRGDDVGSALVRFELIHLGDAEVSADGSYKGLARPPVATFAATSNSLLSGLDIRRDNIRKYQLTNLMEIMGKDRKRLLVYRGVLNRLASYVETRDATCDLDRKFRDLVISEGLRLET